MSERCAKCGGLPTPVCNRAVCSFERALWADIQVGSTVERMTAPIPPNVHRGRVEAELLRRAADGAE